MKKITLTIILLSLLGGFASFPKMSYSAEHNIGWYGFYAWWKPVFREYYNNYESEDDIFIMGPIYSVKFLDKWTFSALLLIDINNITDATYSVDGTSSYAPGTPYQADIKTTVSRTDLDLSLSYKFESNLSGFIGIKLLDYTLGVEDIDPEVAINSPYSTRSDVDTWSDLTWLGIGPAIGVTYTVPLNDFLFFTIGTSMLYSAFFVDKDEQTVDGSGFVSRKEKESEYSYNAFGNNTTMNLSCYISPLSSSVVLGGRFQVLKYYPVDDAPSVETDYFYGVTLAVVYHI